MGACGRSLLLEPFLSSAVIATAVLRAFADDAAAAELLTRMASGEAIAVLAHFEPDSRFETQWVTTRARASPAMAIGSTATRPWSCTRAPPTRCSSRRAPPASLATRRASRCFGCRATRQGLKLDSYPTIDGQRAADVYLQGVEVPAGSRLGAEGARAAGDRSGARHRARGAVRRSRGRHAGAASMPPSSTCSTRQQFGVPIGRFQALQHRIADMLIHLEQARSMSYLAALRCADDECARAAPRAVGGQGGDRPGRRFVGQQAVQLHGGMGMTDELIVSHWFKRLDRGRIDVRRQRYAFAALCCAHPRIGNTQWLNWRKQFWRAKSASRSWLNKSKSQRRGTAR